MEVCLTGKRLRAAYAHCIERNVYQSHIYTLNIRLAEPRCAEMTGEELQQSKMRCYQIIDVLLSFGKSFLVRGSKFLLAIEGVRMTAHKLAGE